MEDKFVLDQHTGEILGHQAAMDTEQYTGRFVPWEGPIPEGGRVDLLTWQSRKVSDQTTLGAELAAFAAEQVSRAEVQPEAPQPPVAPKPLTAEQHLGAIEKAVSKFIMMADDTTQPQRMQMVAELNTFVREEQQREAEDQKELEAPEEAAPPMTDEQRLEKITEAISTLKGVAFLPSGEPNLIVLSAFCGFDVKEWRLQNAAEAEAQGSIGNS